MNRTTALRSLTKIVARGESRTLELKRSTGELRETMQALCGFANADGGHVVVGVRPDGQIVGQQISEQTFHEIAAARDRFEPPLAFDVERIDVAEGLSVIVLTGAVEIWGRGTNRVLEECERHGVRAPSFEERHGAVVVTFRVALQPGATPRHQVGTKSAPSPRAQNGARAGYDRGAHASLQANRPYEVPQSGTPPTVRCRALGNDDS